MFHYNLSTQRTAQLDIKSLHLFSSLELLKNVALYFALKKFDANVIYFPLGRAGNIDFLCQKLKEIFLKIVLLGFILGLTNLNQFFPGMMLRYS